MSVFHCIQASTGNIQLVFIEHSSGTQNIQQTCTFRPCHLSEVRNTGY